MSRLTPNFFGVMASALSNWGLSDSVQDNQPAVNLRQILLSMAEMTPADRLISLKCDISPWLIKLAYLLGRRVILPSFFREIEVFGREVLPKDDPLIFAPTHRSRWDAIVVPYAVGHDVTGKHLRFMVTDDEVKGLQGWLISHLGGFPIDTRHPTISALRYGIDILKNRQNLVIFPEGDIYRGRPVKPLKPGLARIALQAEGSQPGLGIQIVPMSLWYSPEIPGWRSRVTVQIGKPIAVADYRHGSTKKSACLLKADVEAALDRIHGQNQARQGCWVEG